MDETKYKEGFSDIVRLENILTKDFNGRISDLKIYWGDTGEFLSNLP